LLLRSWDELSTDIDQDKKTILSPEYVYDTYTRAIEASTKRDTFPRLPNIQDYLVLPVKRADTRILTDSSEDEQSENRPAKKRRTDGNGHLPDLELFEEDVELEGIPRYCIERASPLVCVNQDLVSGVSPSNFSL
jgi:DNA polymerase mu